MAKRLTEEMVIARTKISDLSKIKRLNCWGSEISDVALLRKMPCVEVLSLSINKINSLADFQFCKRLEELYIRQNNIRDLNEIVYLQNLPNLKNLWLGENPCADTEGYRLSVIKALPQLQKLDNVQITQEELREAQRRGRNLAHPEDVPESEEEEYIPTQPQQQHGRYQDYSDAEYSPVQRVSPRQEPDYENEESEDCFIREEMSEESKDNSPPPPQLSPPRKGEPVRRSYSPDCFGDKRRDSYERDSPRQNVQCFDRYQMTEAFGEIPCDTQPPKLVSSQSASCIKEYTNGDRYVQAQVTYRHPEGSEVSSSAQSHDRRERYSCPAAAHKPPFTRRPVTRNSNILSAVLCLVKELDYPSLEVVEMAVRCRMDELDD